MLLNLIYMFLLRKKRYVCLVFVFCIISIREMHLTQKKKNNENKIKWLIDQTYVVRYQKWCCCCINKFSIKYRKFSNSKPINIKIQGSFHQITIKSWSGMIEYALSINKILVLSAILLFIGNAKAGPCELWVFY